MRCLFERSGLQSGTARLQDATLTKHHRVGFNKDYNYTRNEARNEGKKKGLKT